MKIIYTLIFPVITQAWVYLTPTPTITSFEASVKEKKIFFDWTVSDNESADRFEIEKSINGKEYKTAALIFGTDKPATENYKYFEKKEDYGYYRIKVLDDKQNVSYSEVITIKSE